MALVTVTRPTSLPVTLSEAKTQCRILDSDTTHDVLLTRLIASSCAYLENKLGVRLGSQTLRLEMKGFKSGPIDLGVYPVASISSFVYDDSTDTQQTLTEGSPSEYWSDLEGICPSLYAVNGWPVAYAGKPASVRITFVAGYTGVTSPITTLNIPEDLKHAALVMVKEHFDHGGDTVTGQVVEKLHAVKMLSDLYRRW